MVSRAPPRSSIYPDLTGPVLTSLSQIAAPDSAVPYTSPQSDLHPLTTRQPLQIDGTPVCVLCSLATLNQPQTARLPTFLSKPRLGLFDPPCQTNLGVSLSPYVFSLLIAYIVLQAFLLVKSGYQYSKLVRLYPKEPCSPLHHIPATIELSINSTTRRDPESRTQFILSPKEADCRLPRSRLLLP